MLCASTALASRVLLRCPPAAHTGDDMDIRNHADAAAVGRTPMMTRRWGTALATLLAAGLAGSPAAAEDAAPASAPWKLSVTPYLWATSLHGKAGVAGKEADVDVSFSDLFKKLNGALMLDLEARKGAFALMSDTVYANLEDNSSAFRGQGSLKVKTTANMLVQGLAGTYRVGTWQVADTGAGPLAVAVDPYAGIRYTYLDTELKGKLDLPDLGVNAQRTAEGDKQWVDPIIGLRTIWTLGERLSLLVASDVGGTSQNSDYSWEAVGVVGYRFGLFGTNNANLLAGYKALHQKYSDGNGRNEFDWDVTMHGPVVGLTLTF